MFTVHGTYSPSTSNALLILSQLIQIRRREKKLTQQALAERVGVSRSLVQRVESADTRCEIGVVFEMAPVLVIQLFQVPDSQPLLRESLTDKLALFPSRVRVGQQVVDNDF